VARRRAPRAAKVTVDHAPSVEAFTNYFARTNNGAKPTWKGVNIKAMNDLVREHGNEEVIRRIAVLEANPPRFPPAPWDMRTFAYNFDKVASQLNNMSGMDYGRAVANGEAV
jgi:hypothetical protein